MRSGSPNLLASGRLMRRLAAALVMLALACAPVAGRATAPRSEPALDVLATQFAEPLVRSEPTSAAEDGALRQAILAARQEAADPVAALAPLQAFAASHPQSGWRLAVLTNLGLGYERAFHFSQAVASFEQAWVVAATVQTGSARPLADRAAGELLRIHAHLGHADRLRELLNQMAQRSLSGPATELRDNAKDGLWLMRTDPNRAFRCGPDALKTVLQAMGRTAPQLRVVDDDRVGANGTSLTQLAALAVAAGAQPRMIHRQPGADIPIPSVVHWQAGHFAAILAASGGRYEVADPTFGRQPVWVSRATLDTESSGFFLAFGSTLSPGWQSADASEASLIRGAGQVGDNYPPSDTTQNDMTAQNAPPTCGMCAYSFLEMSTSLSLRDTPVGYVPPRGPAVKVQISYTQREASQPATMAFFNVSPKWTLNWLTYIQDDPANPGSSVSRYAPGGGSVPQSGYNGATGSFAADFYDGSILTYNVGGAPSYQRSLRDGSTEIFSVSNGAVSYPRLLFLSKVIDAAGNALTLNYDGQLRLVSITDATGRNTTFGYANGANPLLVTSITDPFGRSAILAYDSSGRLSQITDVLGLTSSFTYDSSSLVDALTTAYGTTTFSYGDANGGRFLQATDPLGNTEREEFREQAPGIADSEAAVPAGVINPVNEYLEYRDTFYWDKHAYAIGKGNYRMARMRHWAHDASGLGLSNTLESEKPALEGRIWYNYPGQPNGFISGTSDQPIVAARLLDDGTTQITTHQYNAFDSPTQSVDPVGRVTTLAYAPNQTDVAAIQRVTSGGPATIASFTYNAQHRPLSFTDAAGQTTRFAYNAAGQITSRTDALGHATQFTYDPLGYLLTIVNADGMVAASYTYDGFGRVASRTDAGGWKVRYQYDALDRLTAETFPDQTSRTYAYSKLDLVTVTDRQGRTTTSTYDGVRNLVAVTDPMQQTTRFGHYENGVVSTLTDPNGNVTTWPIDVEGRVTGKIYADKTTYTNVYEATTSRLRSTTDPLGQSKVYSYLADNSVAAISYLNAVNPTPNVSFGYDPYFRRVTAMTDGTGTTTYSYEPVGALGALKLASENPPFANSAILYQYDALGRPVSRSVGGDIERIGYDALGRIASHADDLGNFQMTYLGETPQLTRRSSGLVGTRWFYDSNRNDRRLTAIVNSPVASRFAYTSTPENDITTISENGGSLLWTLGYDNADRLTSATPSSGSPYQYGYDAANNLAAVQNPLGTTQVASNQLNEIASYGASSFKYDANGNLLSDYIRTYRWDAENRLVGIGYPNQPGAATQIAYDGRGRRTSITDNTGAVTTQTYYGWCGARLCQARTAAGAEQKSYFSEGEAGVTPNSAIYYGVDHLGSVRDVISAHTGLRQRRNSFGPYGTLSSTIGAPNTQSDKQYAGLFYHPLSGLMLATFRAYDPATGRWLSRDPVGEFGGTNIFAYSSGSPLDNSDELGLCSSGPQDLSQLLALILATEIAGLGPEDPIADAAVIAEIADYAAAASEVTEGVATAGEATAEGAEGLAGAADGLAPRAPDFVVTPGGDVIPVPEGATGPIPTTNNLGFQFNGGGGGNGLASNVTDVRIMEPNAQNPTGYVNYGSSQSNGGWQSVNPYSGQSISPSNPWWHIPINTGP